MTKKSVAQSSPCITPKEHSQIFDAVLLRCELALPLTLDVRMHIGSVIAMYKEQGIDVAKEGVSDIYRRAEGRDPGQETLELHARVIETTGQLCQELLDKERSP